MTTEGKGNAPGGWCGDGTHGVVVTRVPPGLSLRGPEGLPRRKTARNDKKRQIATHNTLAMTNEGQGNAPQGCHCEGALPPLLLRGSEGLPRRKTARNDKKRQIATHNTLAMTTEGKGNAPGGWCGDGTHGVVVTRVPPGLSLRGMFFMTWQSQ